MTLTSFMYAMVMYPDIQQAARAELDQAIGRDRLPEISDRDSCPYIMAIFNEVLRYVSALVTTPHY